MLAERAVSGDSGNSGDSENGAHDGMGDQQSGQRRSRLAPEAQRLLAPRFSVGMQPEGVQSPAGTPEIRAEIPRPETGAFRDTEFRIPNSFSVLPVAYTTPPAAGTKVRVHTTRSPSSASFTGSASHCAFSVTRASLPFVVNGNAASSLSAHGCSRG